MKKILYVVLHKGKIKGVFSSFIDACAFCVEEKLIDADICESRLEE